MRYRAMTYNIRSGRNLAGTLDIGFAAQVLREADPDFAGLQEVRSHTGDIGPVNQAEQLGERLGWNWRFGKSIVYGGGEYGNAFLTKHPILESQVIDIPDAPEGSGPYQEHRTLFRNVIDLSGTRLVVLCTHFGLCEAEQRLAIQTALEQLARERDPVVLLGDLNMKPENPCLNPLYDALLDTAERKPMPLTFPSGEPKAKIDYIFTDTHQKHIDLTAMDTQNSDHRPLLATIALEASCAGRRAR